MSRTVGLSRSMMAACLFSPVTLPAAADPADVVAAVRQGTLYGGLTSFVVSGPDASKIQFSNRKLSNGTYLVDRAADSDQHVCMAHANATWAFAFAANPGGTVTADAASKTDQAQIVQCNLAWHKKVKAALGGRQITVLTAKVAEKDKTISASFQDTLASIRIEAIQYSGGEINSKNAQALLEKQFNDISAKNAALTKTINDSPT